VKPFVCLCGKKKYQKKCKIRAVIQKKVLYLQIEFFRAVEMNKSRCIRDIASQGNTLQGIDDARTLPLKLKFI
jgi:hypothetical protein